MHALGLIIIFVLIALNNYALAFWINNPESAIERGKRTGRIIIFYFYSRDCPYCHQMETFVLGDKDVENYIKDKFIFVPVDYEEDMEFSDRFGVYGTPTFIFFDPKKGRVIDSIFGSREKEDFLNILKRICNKSKLLRRC